MKFQIFCFIKSVRKCWLLKNTRRGRYFTFKCVVDLPSRNKSLLKKYLLQNKDNNNNMNLFSLLLMRYCLLIYLSPLPFAPKAQADLQKVSKSEVTTPSAEKMSQTGEFQSKETR